MAENENVFDPNDVAELAENEPTAVDALKHAKRVYDEQVLAYAGAVEVNGDEIIVASKKNPGQVFTGERTTTEKGMPAVVFTWKTSKGQDARMMIATPFRYSTQTGELRESAWPGGGDLPAYGLMYLYYGNMRFPITGIVLDPKIGAVTRDYFDPTTGEKIGVAGQAKIRPQARQYFGRGENRRLGDVRDTLASWIAVAGFVGLKVSLTSK